MKITIPKNANMILSLLSKHNFDAYVVGGCVRDSLLLRDPQDFDICTNALPDDMIKIFRENNFKVIETGLKHGTVTVVFDDEQFEITTYRIDGEYLDHRRPENVIFTSSLEEDLARRDFTINAMAYNDEKGLIDPFSGQRDLKSKLIKSVGNAENRFSEDALRILRGARFATQLNFKLDEETSNAMTVKRHLLKNISEERVRVELVKILLSDQPSEGVILLKNLRLLEFVLKELIDTIDFDQKNPHHDKDVFHHILSVLDNTPKILEVRLAALLHDIGKPKCFTIDAFGIGHFYKHHLEGEKMSKNILKRLKFDNRTIEIVSLLVREHMSISDSFSMKGLKRLINRVGIHNLDYLFALQIADIKGSKPPHDFSVISNTREKISNILNEKQPLSIKDLNVTGYDLIKLGIPQGKEIGIILNALLDQVLEDPKLNERKKILDIIKLNFL